MFKWGRKGKEESNNDILAEGILLRMDAFSQKENRGVTLLLKGIMVYLIVMGGMGCFLSAVDVDYAEWVVHLVLLLSAIFCSLLYYNNRWENIGYLLLLVVMFLAGNGCKQYINSGFYAVANDLADETSAFFDSNAMRSYGEQISNRYLAITVAMCYVGCVCCILMNILISRRMQYILAIPLCFGALLMPLYLELEPSLLYVVMLVGGLLSAYIVRGNGHYHLSQENTAYQYYPKDKRFTYVYAGKTLAGAILAVFLFCFVVVQILGLIYPRERFQENRTTSPVKAQTLDTVENFSLLGFMGLFNFYPNTGGMTNGTLGGVSAVRLDYEPDLTLEFAPYTDQRMYFKTFTGAKYLPYANRWSRQENEQQSETVDSTTQRMKAAYESGNQVSAKGLMKITNVAAATGYYLPYYSEEIDRIIYPGETVEYTYYPKVSSQSIQFSEKKHNTQKSDWRQQEHPADWLEIPEENREVIRQFCQDAGLLQTISGFSSYQKGEDFSDREIQQIASVLSRYYQDNIPYTYRPGLTPRQKDFVNYFLQENKRGYCAHFASAATLIFRYLGIPARYVEGYAIDPEDISEEGKILQDKNYAAYYKGYSPMGETGVVSVNATDANAHAWVEVFDWQQGWQVVEVTPASDEEAQDENSIWRRFMRFLNGGGSQSASGEESKEKNTAIVDENTRKVSGRAAVVLLVLFVVAVAGQAGVRLGIQCYRYWRAGRNERLIMRYQQYIRKMGRRQEELRQQYNYREQLSWLWEHGFWDADEKQLAQDIRILEKAGFSPEEITPEEFGQMAEYFRTGKKKGKNLFS